MNGWLIHQSLEREVGATISSFSYGKSHGPEGLTSEFLPFMVNYLDRVDEFTHLPLFCFLYFL